MTTPPSASSGKASSTIWTPTFMLLAAAQFVAYSHQGLLTPIIPLFVVYLGYSEATVGLVLAAFATAGFMIRPLMGYFADTRSVRGVFSLGGLLLTLPAFGLMVPSIWVIGLANALRGIGWSAFNTGGNTLLAHIAPPSRRGEAASYGGLFQNVASSLAPPFALWLLALDGARQNFTLVFLFGVATASLVLGLSFFIPGNVGSSHSPAPSSTAGGKSGLGGGFLSQFYDRGVFMPSMLLVCMTLTNPTMAAFVPLYALYRGIPVESVGWYYLAVGLSALIGRFFLGAVSDRFGRGPALVAGFTCVALGPLTMSFASSIGQFVLAGILFSVGLALHQPSALALAIDRSDPQRRGAAMASYSLWYQVGTGTGSAVAGLIAASVGYTAMYLVAILAPLAGLLIVANQWRNLRPASSAG